MSVARLFSLFSSLLDRFRLRLASPDALLLLSLLGVITGLLTGLVIVLFRFLLEFTQIKLFSSGLVDDFESLTASARFVLPIAGALFLAALFHAISPRHRQVGVLHVMERLQYHQGRLPWINMLAQFIGAGFAILTGHSVGREGPNIHMGAYSGSWLAQRLQLPNNSTRTLVACGTAAAIGASFNTPLAGIIFAMEVILQQYTVQGFLPVIAAAVSGTYLSLGLLEDELFFEIVVPGDAANYDWYLILLLGVGIGVLSALFNFLLIQLTRFSAGWPIWQRFLVAGLVMGLVGAWQPEAMGVGYDTMQRVLDAELGLQMLTLILLAKLLATVFCLGMGIPGGVIGPLMFLGSVAGAVLVTFAYSGNIGPLIPTEPKLYPLLGMGAMFAASLQAPLAGLTAIMELAGNADIILPAMLAIVSASLTNKVIFHHDSLFLSLLRARGLDHSSSPVMQRLRMIGAASVMNRSFCLCGDELSRSTATTLLGKNFEWMLITDSEHEPRAMLRTLDLQSFLVSHPDTEMITLSEIPAKRLQLAPLSFRASLQEALDKTNSSGAEALYLYREKTRHIYGVITREKIDKSYQ